jgi:hypothetical protein
MCPSQESSAHQERGALWRQGGRQFIAAPGNCSLVLRFHRDFNLRLPFEAYFLLVSTLSARNSRYRSSPPSRGIWAFSGSLGNGDSMNFSTFPSRMTLVLSLASLSRARRLVLTVADCLDI